MEIDEDIKFQRRVWTVERVGWAIVAVVIAAALAGIFGNGPLSRASAQAAGLQIVYERFARSQQSTELRCVVSGGQPELQIALSRDYLDSFHIETITPAPVRNEAAGEWLVYRFAGAAPLSITFNLKPKNFDSVIGSVRTGAGETVTFHQFIYP